MTPGNVAKTGRAPGFYTWSRAAYLTCAATRWCLKHCYALNRMALRPNVARAWIRNSRRHFVPLIPENATLVRIHVSGDFGNRVNDLQYIERWRLELLANPNVKAWAYTRTWRVRALLPWLSRLRRDVGPRLQLFASMDPSMRKRPPRGWRVAWLDVDDRARGVHCPHAQDGTRCVECGYCFDPDAGDLILRHRPGNHNNHRARLLLPDWAEQLGRGVPGQPTSTKTLNPTRHPLVG
jgi:hypothetical protein